MKESSYPVSSTHLSEGIIQAEESKREKRGADLEMIACLSTLHDRLSSTLPSLPSVAESGRGKEEGGAAGGALGDTLHEPHHHQRFDPNTS